MAGRGQDVAAERHAVDSAAPTAKDFLALHADYCQQSRVWDTRDRPASRCSRWEGRGGETKAWVLRPPRALPSSVKPSWRLFFKITAGIFHRSLRFPHSLSSESVRTSRLPRAGHCTEPPPVFTGPSPGTETRHW